MRGIFEKMELSDNQRKFFIETIEAFPGFSIHQFVFMVSMEIRLTYKNYDNYFVISNGIFINGVRDCFLVDFRPNNEPANKEPIQINHINEEVIPYLKKWLECLKAETNLN